jgi:hypothetical protein
MPDFAVRWDSFTGGDYGQVDASRADQNQFTGRNVQVYRSGLLGPRAGFKQLTVTGLPNHPVVDGPMGFDVFDDKLVIVLDDIYEFPIAGGASTGYSTYPESAASPVEFVRGSGILYSLYNGVLYKHVGTSTSAITTPSTLSHIVRWGKFMVGVDAVNTSRIWHSTVTASGPNFDSWSANAYYDIGNNEPITALTPVYNSLYVGKKSGWWMVSGVLGEQTNVREVVIGNGPFDPRNVSVTTDNRVVYWPVEQVPAFFNGESVRLVRDQRLDVRSLPFKSHTAIVTPTDRTLILAGEDLSLTGTDWLMHRDGAWFRHFTPFDLGALAPADVRDAASLPDGVIYAVARNASVGSAPIILSWDHSPDRPAHSSDTYGSPTDYSETELVTGTVTLPAWFDGQGRQVRVRSLVVQFRKWASGVASTYNQMRVAVDALGPYGGGKVTTTPEAWVETAAAASTDGDPDSFRVNLGDQGWANGFQVRFPALRGVALQEVVALVDVRTTRT